MQVSSTADATFDVARQVHEVVDDQIQKIDHARLVKLKDVQDRIEALRRRGLLKRQEYSVPSSADFQKMFLNRDNSTA